MIAPIEQVSAEVHEHWMGFALQQAAQAAQLDEVPIGAVLVDVENQQIIGSGFNQPIRAKDPTAHAEILAIRSAAQAIGNYRLANMCLYVTIEPCTMCVGALVHTRVSQLVFGAREPKAGAVISRQQLLVEESYNHRITHLEGVMAAQCSALMTAFFQTKRSVKTDQ